MDVAPGAVHSPQTNGIAQSHLVVASHDAPQIVGPHAVATSRRGTGSSQAVASLGSAASYDLAVRPRVAASLDTGPSSTRRIAAGGVDSEADTLPRQTGRGPTTSAISSGGPMGSPLLMAATNGVAATSIVRPPRPDLYATGHMGCANTAGGCHIPM